MVESGIPKAITEYNIEKHAEQLFDRCRLPLASLVQVSNGVELPRLSEWYDSCHQALVSHNWQLILQLFTYYFTDFFPVVLTDYAKFNASHVLGEQLFALALGLLNYYDAWPYKQADSDFFVGKVTGLVARMGAKPFMLKEYTPSLSRSEAFLEGWSQSVSLSSELCLKMGVVPGWRNSSDRTSVIVTGLKEELSEMESNALIESLNYFLVDEEARKLFERLRLDLCALATAIAEYLVDSVLPSVVNIDFRLRELNYIYIRKFLLHLLRLAASRGWKTNSSAALGYLIGVTDAIGQCAHPNGTNLTAISTSPEFTKGILDGQQSVETALQAINSTEDMPIDAEVPSFLDLDAQHTITRLTYDCVPSLQYLFSRNSHNAAVNALLEQRYVDLLELVEIEFTDSLMREMTANKSKLLTRIMELGMLIQRLEHISAILDLYRVDSQTVNEIAALIGYLFTVLKPFLGIDASIKYYTKFEHTDEYYAGWAKGYNIASRNIEWIYASNDVKN